MSLVDPLEMMDVMNYGAKASTITTTNPSECSAFYVDLVRGRGALSLFSCLHCSNFV
jgi:hypothetical protein